MTKFTDNPAVQAMVVRMAKDKLPPGVKRATQQADKSALIASAKPARQAIQGYLGMDPSYSVMDPQAEKLASAYRTGEATSVLGDLAGALSPFAYASALSKVGQVPGIAELIAYHGSPHKFKKFDASKIGTGEGAQSYGHGLYFAENPEVAKNYAFGLANKQAAKELTNLSKSSDIVDQAAAARVFYDDAGIKEFITAKNKNLSKNEIDRIVSSSAEKYQKLQSEISSFYKVDIPDEKIAQMLDWDKPLSQQPKAVQEAINKSEYALRDMAMDLYGKKDPLGSEIARAALKPQEFAEHMKELGVPGIRYLDQGSRGTGKGTSNFVVFPGEEESIKMLEINGTPEMAKGGPVRMQDGGAVNMAGGGAARKALETMAKQAEKRGLVRDPRFKMAPGSVENLAGKSYAQWAAEQQYKHELEDALAKLSGVPGKSMSIQDIPVGLPKAVNKGKKYA